MHACALWAHCRLPVSWGFLGDWVFAVCVQLVCWSAGGPSNVMLGVVPA